MKIYILPIDPALRPEKQTWSYPNHNQPFGVEQDFFQYLLNNPKLISQNPAEADWHYLGVYWTRWHLGNKQKTEGKEFYEFQRAVSASILNDKKTFTICQYDDGPVANIGNTIQFLASRMTEFGIDIPLLSSDHQLPFFKQRKKYTASFMGRLDTHSIRKKMANVLQSRKDIYIFNKHKSPKSFVKTMLQSYVALCPRGYGGSSFRFFEAMQLGIVPLLIGNLDTRPFKKFIPFDEFSFFTNDPDKINDIIDSKNKDELLIMGKKCISIYKEKLAYQKWCELVIKTLDDRR